NSHTSLIIRIIKSGEKMQEEPEEMKTAKIAFWLAGVVTSIVGLIGAKQYVHQKEIEAKREKEKIGVIEELVKEVEEVNIKISKGTETIFEFLSDEKSSFNKKNQVVLLEMNKLIQLSQEISDSFTTVSTKSEEYSHYLEESLSNANAIFQCVMQLN